MTNEQMMATWQAQDAAPLYGVNRYLLQSVLQQEENRLRREQRVEHWTVYVASAGLLLFLGVFLYAFVHKGAAWNIAGTAVAIGAIAAGAMVLWLSRRRQARRERGFGASVGDEIRRNLSLVDYELSRRGRTEQVLLTTAPFYLAAVLMIWLAAGLNEKPLGWSEAGMIPILLAVGAASSVYGSRKARRELTPRRQRLSELLDSLNAGE